VSTSNLSIQALLSLGEGEELLNESIQSFFLKKIPNHNLELEKWKKQVLQVKATNEALFSQPVDLNTALSYRYPPSAPLPPVFGLNVSTGLGKTYTSLNESSQFLRNSEDPIYFFVPTHDLGAEHLDTFNSFAKNLNLTGGVIRGYDRPNPDNLEEKMCLRQPVIEPLIKQGIRLNGFCENKKGLCPHHPKSGKDYPCSYRMQFEDPPDLIFLPHQYLFNFPASLPDPAAIIIDESFWQASLEGFGTNDNGVSISALTESPAGAALVDAISVNGDAWLSRGQLMSRGINAKTCDELIKSERKKFNPDISADLTKSEADKIAKNLKDRGSYQLIPLWQDVKCFLTKGKTKLPLMEIRNIPSSNKRASIDNRLYIYREKQIDSRLKKAPTLILDATLSERLVSRHFPQFEANSIEVEMPYVHIRQITDKALAARMMIPTELSTERKNKERLRNVQRLHNHIECEAQRFNGFQNSLQDESTSILHISQLKLESELKKIGLPNNVETAHFNAVKGLNTYSNVQKIVISGRTLPRVSEVEKMASVLMGHPIETVGSAFPLKHKPIFTTNNVTQLVEAPYHPNPLVEEIRRQICEAELIQAFGRGRGIRRTAKKALEIDVLTNVPLPFQVDELTTWKEIIPDDFDRCLMLHGVLPLSKGELARVYKHFFENRDVARYRLRDAGGVNGVIDRYWGGKLPNIVYKGNLPPQTIKPWVVRYKRPGRGHGPNWITALIHPQHQNPRTALEAKVGPVTAFELLPQ
jgi:putative DNA primase/helicase